MRIEVREAHETVVATLRKAGLEQDDARTVAEALVDAELSGRKGHGLNRVPPIVSIAAGAGSGRIRVTKDSGATISLDAGGALGYLAASRASNLVRERLRTQPIAAAAVRGTSHAGAIGYYARFVAEAGHCAIAMAHCSPLLAPHGAHTAVFGTNPIAFACPGPDHPLVADISPASITYGALTNARRRGEVIPNGVAVDSQGNPTNDPSQALAGAILPVAGAKGSALAFLVQVITGALCGAAAVPRPGEDYGFFLLGMQSNAFAPGGDVQRHITDLVDAVHAAGALCPGDRSEALRKKALRVGIEVDDALWSKILSLAQRQSD